MVSRPGAEIEFRASNPYCSVPKMETPTIGRPLPVCRTTLLLAVGCQRFQPMGNCRLRLCDQGGLQVYNSALTLSMRLGTDADSLGMAL